jgi:menaquinone-specific isochorismate synthase
VTLPTFNDDDESLPAETLSALRAALLQPLRASASYLSVTLEVPTEAPEKFLRLIPRTMGFIWRSPRGEQFAGGGAAAIISVNGENRFEQLQQRSRELFARIESRALDGKEPVSLVVGGAAFAPHVPPVSPWEEFVDDTFVLSRWGYRRTREHAWLTITLHRDELALPGVVDEIVERTRELTRALDYESATSLIERMDIPRAAVHHMSEQDWTVYIDAIHQAIASGQYQKIVAARRCVVDLQRPVEDTGFMARVFAAYPDCTHFAFRRESSTFLGATPETLFRKVGTELVTHALAGTIRVKDDPRNDSSRDVNALLASAKDQVEHAMVVQKICESLWPLSKRIRHAQTPETRQVRTLIHLQTPISGELKETTTAANLLNALHPTPAVGGFPAREAALWIRENEPMERGWYTGTVGWLDANGDAEFAVAIRCGVLQEKRATIFAGAGVVAASTAASEYAETAGKMSPVLRALGVAV